MEMLCLYRLSARTFTAFMKGLFIWRCQHILTVEAISNKLWLKLGYAKNLRQHKAAINRCSSRSASQGTILVLNICYYIFWKKKCKNFKA